MKKSLITLLAITGLALSLSSAAYAGEEKTITGEAKCAKCILKQTDSCQNAVQVKENGKTITYLLAKNDVSKKFHENVCTESKQVKVTGTVKEVDGKLVFDNDTLRIIGLAGYILANQMLTDAREAKNL